MSILEKDIKPIPKRPRRTPLEAAERNRLVVNGLDEENYTYRWVNDTGERILQLKDRGYEFVNSRGKIVGDMTIDSAKLDSSIVSQRMGGGITAYLMAIPKEYYEEDQAYKRKRLKETEEALFSTDKEKGNYGKIDVRR